MNVTYKTQEILHGLNLVSAGTIKYSLITEFHCRYQHFGGTYPPNLFFFNVHGTVHCWMCILYNQDATYTMFFIIISALHVSGGFSAHHQELIKLYVQPWVLSCFPAVYRWCGWIGTVLSGFVCFFHFPIRICI